MTALNQDASPTSAQAGPPHRSLPAIAFGPVPSRRLGRSLGINHVPAKTCSYACIYCQVGSTNAMAVKREPFFSTEDVAAAVRERLASCAAAGEKVDYLTFVPDGEPTLDADLPAHIRALRPLGVPIAIITNGSLLWDLSARNAVALADWVSIKVDATDERLWREINRPHGSLRLADVLAGAVHFAASFRGILTTETMLVDGLNSDDVALGQVAAFLRQLQPAHCYLSVPSRPPAEPWVRPPPTEVLAQAVQLYRSHRLPAEGLAEYEGNQFSLTGNAPEDLLSICAVHPMREDAVRTLLERSRASPEVVQDLIDSGELEVHWHQGNKFYRRRWSQRG